jgi:hypothetical protein
MIPWSSEIIGSGKPRNVFKDRLPSINFILAQQKQEWLWQVHIHRTEEKKNRWDENQVELAILGPFLKFTIWVLSTEIGW